MKYAFVARHRGIWPVRWQCAALGVSRSGFYAWSTRGESSRSRQNHELLRDIRTSFVDSDRTYGSPRVWRDLAELGYRVSENRVARLMRRERLVARPKRRRLPTANQSRPESRVKS